MHLYAGPISSLLQESSKDVTILEKLVLIGSYTFLPI